MTVNGDADHVTSIKLSKVVLPLKHAFSDAKVLTGRQSPLLNVALMFAEISTAGGASGMGFTYALRVGGEGQFSHAREIAPLVLGEDPHDISIAWTAMPLRLAVAAWRSRR